MAKEFVNSVTLEFSLEKTILSRLLRMIPGSKARKNLDKTAINIGDKIIAETVSNIRNVVHGPARKFPPFQGQKKPLWDQGGLAASIKKEIITTSSLLSIEVGSKLPYSRILEEGGTITPKNGKFLTIPVSTKYRGIGARSVQGLYRIRNTRLLAVNVGGRQEIAYVLAEQAVFKARPYLKPAGDTIAPQAVAMIASLFRKK